jgi:hypothetical protein
MSDYRARCPLLCVRTVRVACVSAAACTSMRCRAVGTSNGTEGGRRTDFEPTLPTTPKCMLLLVPIVLCPCVFRDSSERISAIVGLVSCSVQSSSRVRLLRVGASVQFLRVPLLLL